jgi:hypothetical protein
MLNVRRDSNAAVSYDNKGVLRSFFGAEAIDQTDAEEAAKAGVAPAELASKFLEDNADDLRLSGIDLVAVDRREGAATTAVMYEQRHHGLPVYGGDVVVSMRAETGHVISMVNHADYEIPDSLTPLSARITKQDASGIARSELSPFFNTVTTREPELVVFRIPADRTIDELAPAISRRLEAMGKGEPRSAHLTWRVIAATTGPAGEWELFVDAVRGGLLFLRDRRDYATTSDAFVFVPDPITASADSSLSSGTSATDLDKLRTVVTLERLDDGIKGELRLDGKWVLSEEIETPSFEPPVSTSDFKFSSDDKRFYSVMAYYWLDQVIEYLRTRGVATFNKAVENVQIRVDAQGLDGADNSHFVTGSGDPYIAFGEGGVPDATDAHVVVHEYVHAVHYYMKSKQNNNGNEEGFGDFVAGAWLDRYNTQQFEREVVFPWDMNVTDVPRRTRLFDTALRFDDANFSNFSKHKKGSVLAASLWDMFFGIGGNSTDATVRQQAADTCVSLFLEMLVSMPAQSSVANLANGLISADKSLNKGTNAGAIKAAFTNRGLTL